MPRSCSPSASSLWSRSRPVRSPGPSWRPSPARSVPTNEKGQYHLSVPAGTHSVRARLIGYDVAEQRVVVPAGQTIIVDFKLTATPLSLNEVVVVGARTSRTAVETPVPVDVITSQEVQETGHTEVNQILATLAPSFNASHQTIADG